MTLRTCMPGAALRDRGRPSGRRAGLVRRQLGAGKFLFWLSAGALAWTHVGYPLAARALARRGHRPVRGGAWTPSVSVVVAAHDEEDVIERRARNLLELDYPADRVEVLVASDASEDGTDAIVEGIARSSSAPPGSIRSGRASSPANREGPDP